MTREEAIKVMEYPIRKWLMDTSYDGVYEAWEMAIAALREQEERSKGCHNCYGNDMEIDAVDNPCWNCKGDHSEWRAVDEPSQIEKLAARYERNMHKPWKKPMTNADRIRAMSDEELAKFLTETMCEWTHKTATERKLIEYTWFKKLRQPVKEDA